MRTCRSGWNVTNLIKFTYNLSLNCCSCKLTKILLRFACHCFDFAFFFVKNHHQNWWRYRMSSWSWCESYRGKVATSNGWPFWSPNFLLFGALRPWQVLLLDGWRSVCWTLFFERDDWGNGGSALLNDAQRICSSCRCDPYPFGEEW